MGGIRDWVVLKTVNVIYISMIRLCTDISPISNRKSWIPVDRMLYWSNICLKWRDIVINI